MPSRKRNALLGALGGAQDILPFLLMMQQQQGQGLPPSRSPLEIPNLPLPGESTPGQVEPLPGGAQNPLSGLSSAIVPGDLPGGGQTPGGAGPGAAAGPGLLQNPIAQMLLKLLPRILG